MSFTYKSIINGYRRWTFKYCKMIYCPIFDIPKKEERYITKEKLANKISLLQIACSKRTSENASQDFYEVAKSIGFILKRHVKCTPDSRAEKYKNKAIKLIDSLEIWHEDIFTYEDIVKIFICLMRQNSEDLESHLPISQIDFSISIDDFKTINRICNHYFTLTEEQRLGIFRLHEKVVEKKEDKIIMYNVLNLVLLRLLEFEGKMTF